MLFHIRGLELVPGSQVATKNELRWPSWPYTVYDKYNSPRNTRVKIYTLAHTNYLFLRSYSSWKTIPSLSNNDKPGM